MSNIESGLRALADKGLNIFASSKVAELPPEIRASFTASDNATLCLVAHGGRTLWANLSHRDLPHPIDTFTRELCTSFARDSLGEVQPDFLFPNPNVLLPLQRLGRFLNIARPSRMGMDIHPEFGLWFAYRAVFLTSHAIDSRAHADHRSPCESCAEKPCISACPAGALATGFHLPSCVSHRLSEGSSCRATCHSRMACPVGEQHRYSAEQLAYHMVRPAHLRKLAEYV